MMIGSVDRDAGSLNSTCCTVDHSVQVTGPCKLHDQHMQRTQIAAAYFTHEWRRHILVALPTIVKRSTSKRSLLHSSSLFWQTSLKDRSPHPRLQPCGLQSRAAYCGTRALCWQQAEDTLRPHTEMLWSHTPHIHSLASPFVRSHMLVVVRL
jgi:hypothetical protein